MVVILVQVDAWMEVAEIPVAVCLMQHCEHISLAVMVDIVIVVGSEVGKMTQKYMLVCPCPQTELATPLAIEVLQGQDLL